MTQATPTDVADRLGRPLTPGEVTQVTAYLADAENALLRKLPNLITDAATNPILKQNLISVEVAVALRAARITDSVQAAYPNPENLSTPAGSARANVVILDLEWRKVGLTWYSSFRLGQDLELEQAGMFPDMNPTWGPWWIEGEEYG